MDEKISVITPSLNSARFIEDAIQSVLIQQYSNFEHIVVDGGSTDGTIEILKKYPHLKWISEPDKGQSDAMNKGFEMSSGEIIVYLNADDYFLPGAFNTVLPYFQCGHRFVVGKVKVLNENGSFWINDPKIKFEEMLKWWAPNAFSYNPTGYFYHRDVQKKVGGFNDKNHLNMDLEFLLDASKKEAFTKIDFILGVFRLFKGTKTYENSDCATLKKKYTFCERLLSLCDQSYIKQYIKEKERHLSFLEEKERKVALLKTVFQDLKEKRYRSAVQSSIWLSFLSLRGYWKALLTRFQK